MIRQLCTFELADLYLALPVERVQEVILEPQISRVPIAPETIKGLINLRGQIVTVIDLRSRLGFDPRDQPGELHVVLRRGAGAVSLLVDDIGDVLEVDDALAAPPPKTLGGVLRELVTTVYKLDGRLLLVLAAELIPQLPAAEVSS